jgi:lipopolysaccharide/colanic/teichoic acid biosynthesis glycosyltransferase
VSSGVFLGTLLSVAFIYVFRTQWGKFPTSIFAISFFVNLILIFKVNLFILKAKKRIKKQVIILGEGKVDDIVDKDGKTFTLYKFRTMVKDAEQKVGPVLAKQDDPRITRIGKVLRRTRMDELPQLFNVLCGQMSLVGIMLQTIPVVFLKKGW